LTSGGNSFTDFPENQLTIDPCISLQACLVERYCITSPCPDIIWGNGIPQKYLGERHSSSTTPLIPVGSRGRSSWSWM